MINSPLRYPGGKAKLTDFFIRLIDENGIYQHNYCEPYAGGGGLALNLLFRGYVQSISLNDIDPSIYAFWHSILNKPADFCSLIETTPVTVNEWHRQAEIWKKQDKRSLTKLGFATYFLNRTNRSGIISGAGPIGGFDQLGKWKIDARFNKKNQISNILSISRFSQQIQVSNLDAVDFIKQHVRKKDTFLYLDPPYYVKGNRLYTNYYEPDDHRLISKLLEKHRNTKWVVSYDNVDPIRTIYSPFAALTYSLGYSAGPHRVGREVLFVSDGLALPKVKGFRRAA